MGHNENATQLPHSIFFVNRDCTMLYESVKQLICMQQVVYENLR